MEHDPDVRQAGRIADAARARLVACMTGSRDMIDLAEAQRMLDAFGNALAYAEEAQDRVLVHHGLLTSAEAGRRAARRRPVTSCAGQPARAARGSARGRRVRRLSAGHVVAGALAAVAIAAAGAAVARLLGIRPPLARW